jgi:hypothetical protein
MREIIIITTTMSGIVIMPKYLNKTDTKTKTKKDTKIALLFALSLPKDVLRLIKTFAFMDDPVFFQAKRYKLRVFHNIRTGWLSDFSPDDDILWEDDVVTYASRMIQFDTLSNLCLQCGNYLCSADFCYVSHSKPVHCLCSHHVDRICRHFL